MLRKSSVHRVILILCTSLYPYLKQWKFGMRKPHMTKSGRSSKNCHLDKWRKSRSRKRSSKTGKQWGKDCSLCYMDGLMPHQALRVGATVPKIQSSCCALRWCCVRRFWLIRCVHGAVFVSVANDGIARPPGCAGEAGDAVSAYTQVKMWDPPFLLKLPMSEFPDTWIRLPRHQWPKSWHNIEEPVQGISTDTPLQVCYGRDSSKKFFLCPFTCVSTSRLFRIDPQQFRVLLLRRLRLLLLVAAQVCRCGRLRFWLIRSVHGAVFGSITNDGSKSSGCSCQTTCMRWASKRRSISLHLSQKWRTLRLSWNFPGPNVLKYRYVYHATDGRRLGRVLKTLWFFWKRFCTDTPLQVCYGRDSSKQFL